MQRALSLILICFTMVTLAVTPSFASIFVPPQKETAPQPKPLPDPKKLLEAQPMLIAVKHCLVLNGIINEHLKLIDAYNKQPDLANLPENINFKERGKAMSYMMGRPDLPDFGFLIPRLWSVTPRDLRQKFNSIATLRLAEIIGFPSNGYPYQNNCKATLENEITKDKQGFEHVRIAAPLAFGTKEVKLVYIMKRQSNYSWYIDDLIINNVGITNFIKKDLISSINNIGLERTIKDICSSSSFSTLNCN